MRLARFLYYIPSHQHDREMEMYYTPITLDAPTIVLIIGLAIMLLGGIIVAYCVKDEEKMFKTLGIVEVVGGILSVASVVMLIV